ncbi:hypothetical protein Bca52824_064673 [Brassica carinata]|uniref:Uncharacterized protein n=1 Tax=Brassica carinata TaxID=52824 RepID=A0A8X7QIA8_BRACI|nr:hypothetical protein Bca52824_064673 [Brassica carinata]
MPLSTTRQYLPPVLHRYTDVTEKLTRLDPVTSSATKDPLYATTGPEIWKVTGARKYLNEQNRTLIWLVKKPNLILIPRLIKTGANFLIVSCSLNAIITGGKDVDIDAKNERSFVANSFAGRFWTIMFASIIYQNYFLTLIIIVD